MCVCVWGGGGGGGDSISQWTLFHQFKTHFYHDTVGTQKHGKVCNISCVFIFILSGISPI